jgi:hypothetical protein
MSDLVESQQSKDEADFIDESQHCESGKSALEKDEANFISVS